MEFQKNCDDSYDPKEDPAAKGENEGRFGNLTPQEYDALRSLATRALKREGRAWVSATSLLHETYLRLAGCKSVSIRDTGHLYAMAARTMRRILVDFARQRRALCRGDGRLAVSIDDVQIGTSIPDESLLAVDDALKQLQTFDRRKHDVIELRFFGRLTIEDTAAAMQISPASVKREWNLARAWLKQAVAE